MCAGRPRIPHAPQIRAAKHLFSDQIGSIRTEKVRSAG